ncbi:MAG TPA: T9SS type A sorting domain-containing protein, partial [Candidatus Kapabacteria bacterium]|nr:T9SS type A sorting domain-containing protein [Candidatus Kapabacteria bacterium]
GKGGKYQITLTITNSGNYTWTPTGIQGLDSAILHYISGLGPIAPGSNIQIVLEVTPDDINHHYNFPLTISGIPCEESAATATVDFTTTSTSVPNLVTEAGFVLGQNHPNPFTASTEFSYTTPTEANIVLSIHDITGKLVKVISSGTVTSGEHTVKLSADEFASGSYLLTLESGSVKLTRQIMIAK